MSANTMVWLLTSFFSLIHALVSHIQKVIQRIFLIRERRFADADTEELQIRPE
jgi:hypothetical protein